VRLCPAIVWLQGRPLGIGGHNLFILLALPEVSEEKELPGGALQWDGMYSGWIEVHAECE